MDWFRYLLSPSFFHYAFYKALFSNLFIAEGSPRLQQSKAYTFFLTILRLEYWSGPGNQNPSTSSSAGLRSTEWANCHLSWHCKSSTDVYHKKCWERVARFASRTQVWSAWQEQNRKGKGKNDERERKRILAWENSRHFATPLLSPRNNAWETGAEIPYWWLVIAQLWIVLLIGCAAWKVCFK